MKNLSIFEPQIEKHYAYKKHVTAFVIFSYFKYKSSGKMAKITHLAILTP